MGLFARTRFADQQNITSPTEPLAPIRRKAAF
jgi:hypothetical protein